MLLPAEVTPTTPADVAAGFLEAARRLSLEVNTNLLATLLAHSALETGHWRALKQWAFGHVKHRDGTAGDHQFIYATENLNAAQVSHALKLSKSRTDGEPGRDMQAVSPLADGRTYCKFWPSHPQARFRAFKTLSAGAEDYLDKLVGTYAKALPFASAGDVAGYVDALHNGGKYPSYFTARLEDYPSGKPGYRTKVVALASKYRPVAVAALDGYDPRMTERDPDPYELPSNIYDRDEALLRMIAEDDYDDPEFEWVDVGGGLEVELPKDALMWTGVRYGLTPYNQQRALDQLGMIPLTPKLADIHAAQARNDGGLVGPFPRPITTSTEGYEAHSTDIDEALPEDDGFVSSFKHWTITKDMWSKRGFATNYGWHSVTGSAAMSVESSVSNPELRVVQGPYEAHGTGKDVDGDGFADSGHLDYSQAVTGARRFRLHGKIVKGGDVYMGKYGGAVAALVSHEGPLPGYRFPGVPTGDLSPAEATTAEVESMPRITHPGEQGLEVHEWQTWLMANGFPLPKYGADKDHGDETETATVAAMKKHGLKRTMDEDAPPSTDPSPSALVTLPPIKIIRARHFRVGRPLGNPIHLFTHTAETNKHPQGAEGLGNYAKNMNDRTVSWHAAGDNNSIVECVDTGDIAFAGGPGNDRGIHFELSTRSHLTWKDQYALDMLELYAAWSAIEALRWDIPIRKVDAAQVYAQIPGFAGHVDISGACLIARRKGEKIRPWWSPTRNRWRTTDHHDPGRDFPWRWFIARVQAYADAA